MVLCSRPECQTTAGCKCQPAYGCGLSFPLGRYSGPEVTDAMVTAAMREFEKYAARLLRYPEKDRWHMNDVTGMREAIKSALRAA